MALRLLQVLHLRAAWPAGESEAMPGRPAWRCARCGQPMAVLRRRVAPEATVVDPGAPSRHPVVHDKPDKPGPMGARTTH